MSSQQSQLWQPIGCAPSEISRWSVPLKLRGISQWDTVVTGDMSWRQVNPSAMIGLTIRTFKSVAVTIHTK